MKRKKKILIWLTIVTIFFLVAAVASAQWVKFQKERPLCPRCNIVLIDIDILRADALPCYGYKRNTAPNICALAQKSVVFADNYAQSTWTLPSMMSTITSQYPFTHGVLKTYRGALGYNVPSLAQTLRGAGYKTLFFGSIMPETITDVNGGTKGYDVTQSVGVDGWPTTIRPFLKQGAPFFLHLYTGKLHMPYLLEKESQLLEGAPRPVGFPVTSKEFSSLVGNSLYKNYDKVFTPLAISERNDLFATISATPTQALVDHYWSLVKTNDPRRINNGGWLVKYETYIDAILKNEPTNGPFARLLYDSVLAQLDKNINNIIETLDSSGVKENTIIAVYSDHGEEFGERGRYGHPQSLYNEIIRAPLIIYVPGSSPQKLRDVTRNIDIFPTLVSLVGVEPPSGLKGASLVSLMVGATEKEGRFAVSQSGENGFSIYDGTWKLIAKNRPNPLVGAELYRIPLDPGEINNVIDHNMSVASSLLAELQKILKEEPAP